MMKKCEYTRTVSGYCDQTVIGDGEFCYWHKKVKEGIAEPTDLTEALSDLPTIRV